MSSPETNSLTPDERTILLVVAGTSIEHGLRTGRPSALRLEQFPAPLQEPRATFVTLRIDGQLRGCMGDLAARSPLAVDVADNAFAAAFRDPRFHELASEELVRLQIHISILSPPEPISFVSETDLLRRLRPGVDGLILQYAQKGGTLLPAVWEKVASPARFVRHLKLKAGIAEDFWSPAIRVFRYTAESFSSDEVPHRPAATPEAL